MTRQYFYYWKSKVGKTPIWIAYSVAHNKKERAIVDKSIERLKKEFYFKMEIGKKIHKRSDIK